MEEEEEDAGPSLDSEARDGSKGHKKKDKKHKKLKGIGKKSKKKDMRDPAIVLQELKKNTVFSEAPITSQTNLAGRPDSLLRSEPKVKRQFTKTAQPYHQSQNLGSESYLHFVIRSTKHEWIRFKPDSLTVVVYGTRANPGYVAGNANPEVASQRHAFRAYAGNPRFWVDPTVMGTGLVKDVSVTLDNVQVPTNTSLGSLLLHYVRFSRIFRTKPGTVLTKTSQIRLNDINDDMSTKMKQACKPFDYMTYNNTDGVRIPIFLDGIFPFSFKNKTLESAEKKTSENLYFPPDTTIEIWIHLHRSKLESFFHPGINSMTEYFTADHVTGIPANVDAKFTILSADLEYECVELNPDDESKAMHEFIHGGRGIYRYDIPRAQHQHLAANASYTKNTFQIMPYAKLMYIAFLPDWATFVMEAKRKPLSGFSRFPKNASEIEISFFGHENLLIDKFERFGMRDERHQISKKVFYQYLKKSGMTDLKFDDFFPRSSSDNKDQSLVQIFVFELSNMLSDKTEMLNVVCKFAAGETSPANTQVVVITVHPNGEATCLNQGSTNYRWLWQFSQNV